MISRIIIKIENDTSALFGEERIIRIESDRMVEILDRAVVILFVDVPKAPVKEGISIGRIEPDRLAVILDSAVVILFFHVSAAAVEKRSGTDFACLLPRLNERRTTTNCDVWIVTETLLPILDLVLCNNGAGDEHVRDDQ